MSITEYLRVLRRYWPVIVVATLIGAAAGLGAALLSPPQYQSNATLFVATQHGTSVAEAYQNNLFSQERARSYAALATSDQVAARAVAQLQAPISTDDLRAKVTAMPLEKTVMLTVSVQDPDPAVAQDYAGAVSAQLVGLIGELETSRRGGTPAAGAVVVDDASYPTQAMGMSMPLKVAIGAVAGFVVGLLLAILAGFADNRLRGREPIEEATGAVLLGALPDDTGRRSDGFVDLKTDGIYAESVRELRNNLRFAQTSSNQPPKVIAVTSPSERDGRTSVAIDLALVLAEAGRAVVLVDGDLHAPEMAGTLPLEPNARIRAERSGVSTVLSGEHKVSEAVISRVTVGDNSIALLPAGPLPQRPGQLWGLDRADAVFTELASIFDYVIVDTPPLNDYSDGANIAALGDGAILLARIRSTRGNALRRALNALKAANVHLIGTVATFDPVSSRTKRRHAKARPARESTPQFDNAPTTRVPAPQSAKRRVNPGVGTGEGR